MEKLFFRLWFINNGLLLLFCFWVLAGLGYASTGSTTPIVPGPGQSLYSSHWVLVVPPLFLVFEVWMFWHEWKRQNSPKKSKIKALGRVPQPLFLQSEPLPKAKKRTLREREKVLV